MPRKPPRYQPLPQLSQIHRTEAMKTRYGKGRGGRPWRRLREKILQRDGYLCQCPLCQGEALPLLADEVDHIIPLAQGGSNAMDNLQAINRYHHQIKTRKEIAQQLRK